MTADRETGRGQHTTLFIVIRDSYGSVSRPKGIWTDRDDAIDHAVSLSGGAEFTETPSDGFRMVGHAQRGASSWQVLPYEVDTVSERDLDTKDHAD